MGPNHDTYSAAWYCQGALFVSWLHTHNFGAGAVVANTDTIPQMQPGPNYDLYHSVGSPHPNEMGYSAIAGFLENEFRRLLPSAVVGYSNPFTHMGLDPSWLPINLVYQSVGVTPGPTVTGDHRADRQRLSQRQYSRNPTVPRYTGRQ